MGRLEVGKHGKERWGDRVIGRTGDKKLFDYLVTVSPIHRVSWSIG